MKMFKFKKSDIGKTPGKNLPSRTAPAYRFLRSGQMIVEAMVALSVLAVSFLGIITLLSRSLSLNRVVSDNYTATYLASEGIEIVKNLLDHNATIIAEGSSVAWNAGFSDGCYELEYDSFSLPQPLASAAQCSVPASFSAARFLGVDPDRGLYFYGAPNETPFKRVVRIQSIGTDEIKVNSMVGWTTRGGGAFDVNLEDHFMHWRP